MTNLKRTIVIGDIHGCLEEFKTLLDKVNFVQGTDRLILLGDLVDRGPNSTGVVQLAMNLKAEAVMGNHEDKLLRRHRHLVKAARDPKYKIPMKPSAGQEEIIRNLSDAQIDWLNNRPLYIRLPEYNAVAVHAGVVPGVALENQTREVLTMVRYIRPNTYIMERLVMPGFHPPKGAVFWADVYDGDMDIIFGHNVVGLTEPGKWTNSLGARCLGIDTGLCFGGRLTACILSPDNLFGREIVQVPALKAYRDFGGGTE